MSKDDPIMSKQLAITALELNKAHQTALKNYVQRLENELETLDELLVCFSMERTIMLALPSLSTQEGAQIADAMDMDDEPDIDVGGHIVIPGAHRPKALLSEHELLKNASMSSKISLLENTDKRRRLLHFMRKHE
jgi:hypothetical protein